MPFRNPFRRTRKLEKVKNSISLEKKRRQSRKNLLTSLIENPPSSLEKRLKLYARGDFVNYPGRSSSRRSSSRRRSSKRRSNSRV